MAESFIVGYGSSSGAIIEVETDAGKTVTVTCQNTEGRKTSKASTGTVKFEVGYGTWTISSTINNTRYKKQVIIDTSKIYKVALQKTTFGVQFDMSTTDYTATYIDDAEGFDPYVVGGENPIWDDIITDFIGCKPCLVKNATRTAYLLASDYTKYEDGSDADITTGASGIAMVEFKKNWYKYSVENDILKFEVANYDRSSDGFVQDAFASIEDSSVIKDYLYYAAYPCSGLSGKGLPTGATNSNIEEIAAAIPTKYGSSYAMEDWTRRMYISGLLMLLMKDANPKFGMTYGDAPGYGYDDDSTYQYKTGCRNTDGLFANIAVMDQDEYLYNTKPPKMLGIEGFFIASDGGDIVNTPINGIISGDSSATSPYLRYKKMPPYGKDHYSDYNPVTVTENKQLFIAKVQAPDASIVLPSLLSSEEPGIGSFLESYICKGDTSGVYMHYSVRGMFGLYGLVDDNDNNICYMTRTIMV